MNPEYLSINGVLLEIIKTGPIYEITQRLEAAKGHILVRSKRFIESGKYKIGATQYNLAFNKETLYHYYFVLVPLD